MEVRDPGTQLRPTFNLTARSLKLLSRLLYGYSNSRSCFIFLVTLGAPTIQRDGGQPELDLSKRSTFGSRRTPRSGQRLFDLASVKLSKGRFHISIFRQASFLLRQPSVKPQPDLAGPLLSSTPEKPAQDLDQVFLANTTRYEVEMRDTRLTSRIGPMVSRKVQNRRVPWFGPLRVPSRSEALIRFRIVSPMLPQF
jgi:hypothetical protein